MEIRREGNKILSRTNVRREERVPVVGALSVSSGKTLENGGTMKRTCKQCGAEFTLSEDEIAFYKSKNLHLPKRCEKCRKENRAKADGETARQTGGQTAGQAVRPYRGKKNGEIKRLVAA